jgi:integrase
VTRRTDREVGRLRSRLTPKETERIRRGGQDDNGVRDRTLVLLMLGHALRIGEALDLRWVIDVDLEAKTLFVRRLKSWEIGTSSPSRGRDQGAPTAQGAVSRQQHIFPSTVGGGRLAKSTINRLFARLGRELNLPVPLCPHMLRHSACTQLVKTNDLVTVQRWAGHASLSSTVLYVGMNPDQYAGIWKAA